MDNQLIGDFVHHQLVPFVGNEWSTISPLLRQRVAWSRWSMATINQEIGNLPNALERQVQTLIVAVERLTQRNHELEWKLGQWNEQHPDDQNDKQVAANSTMIIPQRTITRKRTTKMKAFEWTNECQKALEELKAYLVSPPLLSQSKPNEKLSLYLAVSPTAVNSALIWKEDHVQLPVYYTSRVLRGTEERYPLMEKLAFTLITAAHKFRPYFEVHTIVF